MGAEPNIIADTQDYLVIEKPAGLIVHHAETLPAGRQETASLPALTDWLLKKYPSIKGVGEGNERPGIVHRLDKDASGLMVIAKTQKMYVHLKKQFQNRQIKKEYLALAHGKIIADQGIINFPLERSKRTGRMASLPQATEKSRQTITEFFVLKRFVNFTYLKVVIKTGRTHQIRSHLLAYGHPLAGDKLYRGKKLKPAGLNRIFLHAAALSFFGLNGDWSEFKSPLPPELNNFLLNLP